MNKRFLVFVLGVVAAAFSAGLRADEEGPKPNIVFIFTDDMGFGDLSCYGHPYAKTPTLDKLAEEGTRFTQAYVTGVTCCPSRTGLMTSKHPARYEKYMSGFGFRDRITITELLNRNGYRTGHFGKWHIGPKESEVDGTYGIDEVEVIGSSKEDPRGRDAALFSAAIDFIKENKKGPFYVNIWGHATHYPVNAHPDLASRFIEVNVKRKDFSDTMQHKFDECEEIGGNLDAAMREYLGDVYSVDLNVKRVLKTLDELGLRENTIVVFSSDHGPAPVILGGKGHRDYSENMLGYAGIFRGGKHSQLEGGLRVPFIIRWPGKVPAGRLDETSVLSFMDWMPTLASIVGIEDQLPELMDGEDVSDIWMGESRDRVKTQYWKASSSGASPSMREGKWKLHFNRKRSGKGTELYDLSVDPSESHNLAEEYPKVVKELSAKLNAWVAELPKDYIKK